MSMGVGVSAVGCAAPARAVVLLTGCSSGDCTVCSVRRHDLSGMMSEWCRQIDIAPQP